MDKVYRGGVCNLAACDISGSDDSLFSTRQPQAGGAIVHRQRYADSSATFTIMPNWPRLTWDFANLYRRGWVMQERWLSPRIIHFSQFPVWECKTALVTEGFSPRDNSQTPDNFLDFPESQREWLFAHENKIGIIERWWLLVRYYTKCSLTYSSDKLVAIAGMARVFSALVDEPYYGGIWGGKHFINSLLWIPMSTSAPPAAPPAQEYRGVPHDKCCPHAHTSTDAVLAPSWSWASLDRHIYTNEFYSVARTLAELVSIHVVPKSRDVFGQLVGGELVFRGFLFGISNPRERRLSLVRCLDDRESANIDLPLYFLPLAELRQTGPFRQRDFGGLFVRVTENVSGKPKFGRVGCRMIDKVLDSELLDADQWERLENLHSSAEPRELITLV